MSLLADPPLLFANGEAYARLAPGSAREGGAPLAGAAVLALFWAVSIPLYLNARWTRPLWRLLPGRDGRDFMVNFPGLRIDTRRVGPRMHALAAVVFATYPAWLWLGWAHGRAGRERPRSISVPSRSAGSVAGGGGLVRGIEGHADLADGPRRDAPP